MLKQILWLGVLSLSLTACKNSDDTSKIADTPTKQSASNSSLQQESLSAESQEAVAHTLDEELVQSQQYFFEPNTDNNTETTKQAHPVQLYYGTDIGQFPKKVKHWILEKFPESVMERPSTIDPRLQAQWSDDGNKVTVEMLYMVAEGYVGAGTEKQGASGSYSGSDLSQYGPYKKYRTLKYIHELKLQSDYLIKSDPAYAEIINFAKQLSSEIEYDWSGFSGYQGTATRTAGKRYAVCSGYAQEVSEKILALSSVLSVEEWIGPNHAWNIINLKDGRKLYFDLTWFDNEHIDKKTGKVYQTDDYDWENITFDEKAFKYSNIAYGSQGFSETHFTHAHGKFGSLFKK